MDFTAYHQSFDATALQARAGQISQGEFLKRTAPTWDRMASKLWERWRRSLPSFVERDDVLQEIQILALQHLASWDPDRGSSVGAYVVWSTTKRVQRQIHKWRGALLSGDEGRNPSRAEVSFSSLSRPTEGRSNETDDPGTRVPAPEFSPEDQIEAGELFADALQTCRKAREAIALLALKDADGSVIGAAERIWKAFAARIECGVESSEEAIELVDETIRVTVARLDERAQEAAADLLRTRAA